MRDKANLGAAQPRSFASTFVRRRERQIEPRMPRDESAELTAGVATGAEDTNRDSMHTECILLHTADVNRFGMALGHRPGSSHVSCRDVSCRCMLSAHSRRNVRLDKRQRHAAILELVSDQPVGSQEELRVLLHRRGWDVTQSTLSRDLRELRLARVPTPEGVRYTTADGALSSAARPALDALLPQLLTRVDGVGELIVVRTVPGGAQPVASALDGESWPDVLGTVGGDDTILVVCRSASARERLERRLRKLAEM